MLSLPNQVSKRLLRMISDSMGIGEIISELREIREAVSESKRLVEMIQYQTLVTPDGLPLPPPELHFLVSGNRNLDAFTFLEIGRNCAGQIASILSQNGVEIDKLESLLDFGCGCGRIIRHFHSLKKTKVYGTDYNRKLIEWCRQNLTFAEFEMNQLQPPLIYRAAQFDLIYAYSVFTHLPEPLQMSWLAELWRVLKPNGHLIMTTHGAAYVKEYLPSDEQEQFAASQLVVVKPELAGENMCGAFHPYNYVKETLIKGFELQAYFPGEAADPSRRIIAQDVYLLRKVA